MSRLLAVIPARGGSKGLPGKNVRPFAGLPLIAHSFAFAKLCPEIDRCIVSTDSAEIAEVAGQFGAEVPFLRAPELARDATPVWEVLRDALRRVEEQFEERYDLLLLLDPTSPTRLPADLRGALERLERRPGADGVIGVSRPEFNPIWHCVVERNGWMADLIKAGARYQARQEVPTVYRINGLLYVWRTSFVRRQRRGWRSGKHVLYELPESRAVSIDTLQEFERAEALLKHGLIQLPWLPETASMVEPTSR